MDKDRRDLSESQEIQLFEKYYDKTLEAIGDRLSVIEETLNNGLVARVERLATHVRFHWIILTCICAIATAVAGYVVKMLIQLSLQVGNL